MKLTLPIAALALAAASVALGEAPANEGGSQAVVQTITQLENQWAAAIAKNDVVAQDKIEAPDYMFSGSNGELMTRADMDGDVVSGAARTESMKLDEVKVRVLGDTAIVHGLETEKSTYKGADTSGQYRFTDIFVKRDGAWAAVATHASLVKK
jgi:ketosteroid isomerase-like protein